MRSIKVMDHSIRCDNPIRFASNFEENTLNNLNMQLKGKVFNNCYIIDINTIRKTSGIRISNTDPNCIGYFNVRFEANIIKYEKGDIIPKAKIRKHDNQYIAETDTLSILLRPEERAIAKLLEEGQFLPIILTGNSTYANMHNKVTSVGTILLPNHKYENYKIEGIIDASLVEKTSSIINLIKEQDKFINDVAVKDIVKLLSLKDNKSIKSMDIIELMDNAIKKPINVKGIWTVNPSMPHKPMCINNENKDTGVVITNIVDALKQLLITIYMRRNVIISLSNDYSSSEWVASAIIWKYMQKLNN